MLICPKLTVIQVAHIHSLPEFSCLLRLVQLQAHELTVLSLDKSYSQLDKFLRESGKPSSNFQAKIESVFSTFTVIASTPSIPLVKRHPFGKNTPRVAPVEFYMISERCSACPLIMGLT